ncbi:MAG TPA: flagellar export chaperone FliS [Nitrospirae bacterium]|nr:flagellar export chaperone FliS [Nitrospirota bacterium]
MNNGPAKAYQVNQVSTVNGSKLILMMYDGAIRFINEAILKVGAQDVAGRGLYISKAQKIINELENSLDKKRGGQVAVNLEKAYQEMSRRLTKANISGEVSDLRVTLKMVNNLKGAWEKVINGSGSTNLSNSGSLRNEMNLSKTAANVAINA